MKQMTTQEAIKFLTAESQGVNRVSAYQIAKVLGLSPIMITRYRKGTSLMSYKTADIFRNHFHIEITDATHIGRKQND